MWLEAKVVVAGIGIILICIVISQILFLNLILSVLLFFGVGLIIFSEIFFSYFYTIGKAKYWVDRPPGNKTLNVNFSLTNLIEPYWVDKGPYGVRRWVQNKKEASCIDRGNYPIHTPHGVLGFLSHEKSEKNINPYEVEMAEQLFNEVGTDDIKEIYERVKAEEKESKEGAV